VGQTLWCKNLFPDDNKTLVEFHPAMTKVAPKLNAKESSYGPPILKMS
jgi:hypothetical protein